MQRGAIGPRTPVVQTDRGIRTPDQMLQTAHDALAIAARWSHPAIEGSHRTNGFKPAADGLRWLCRFLVEHQEGPSSKVKSEVGAVDEPHVADDDRPSPTISTPKSLSDPRD